MYAAQETPQIDAARAEKDPFRTETDLGNSSTVTLGGQMERHIEIPGRMLRPLIPRQVSFHVFFLKPGEDKM
jgi:hypothetical protein